MKRFVSILLVLMLCLAALPMTALAASGKTMFIPVNGSDGGQVYLRKGPGLSYGVFSKVVKHGDVVVPQGDKSGEWSKVKVNRTGQTGWVKTMYYDGTTKELCNGWREVKLSTGGSLKLRKGPGTNYGVKDYVKYGDTVKVLQFNYGWVKVTDKRTGITGWIMQKYVGGKASSETPTEPVTPPTTSGQEVRRVNTPSGLHIRKSPNGTIIRTLSNGTGFRVIGESGNWYKVKLFDKYSTVGYVFKQYTTKGAYAKVTASALYLRKGPSQSSAQVTKMPHGATMYLARTTGNWAYGSYGTKKGYASLTYLKVDGN